ncbi:hypothetical protein IE81DRAFT_161229 [Ceraceosorus guamensis]|uniref:Uncharacterized protein n=1 Tax=Ceraceosorus guamensis TaxID=1522189 RepID=A0A316VW28_9BASI|nr:hypothetical protein IE81DRAFT_161229 [Ceraceosorus guamensis]PWN41700.1 hypothetical protein IE81DRAFT_161229 [Ceraceosorus guamensis]
MRARAPAAIKQELVVFSLLSAPLLPHIEKPEPLAVRDALPNYSSRRARGDLSCLLARWRLPFRLARACGEKRASYARLQRHSRSRGLKVHVMHVCSIFKHPPARSMVSLANDMTSDHAGATQSSRAVTNAWVRPALAPIQPRDARNVLHSHSHQLRSAVPAFVLPPRASLYKDSRA